MAKFDVSDFLLDLEYVSRDFLVCLAMIHIQTQLNSSASIWNELFTQPLKYQSAHWD